MVPLVGLLAPGLALAEETAAINSGDTAWLLTATALVSVHDHPGFVAILWWSSAKKQRAIRVNAMLRHNRINHYSVGVAWL